MDGYIINKVTSAAVNQYAPVKISTNLVAHFADDTDTLFGIATASADSGANVGVQVNGVAQVLVSGSSAVVAGDLLMGGAALLVKYASGTGHKAVARALEPVASGSKVIRVQLLADRQTGDT
jgi:hypothetical protein